MAINHTNYRAIKLSAGNTYTTNDLGNGVSASTVHQVFCNSSGTITLTALGGGTFDWTATSGQYIDIILGACSVASGEFIGFKAPSTADRTKRIFY